jgi:hypothetical protein
LYISDIRKTIRRKPKETLFYCGGWRESEECSLKAKLKSKGRCGKEKLVI